MNDGAEYNGYGDASQTRYAGLISVSSGVLMQMRLRPSFLARYRAWSAFRKTLSVLSRGSEKYPPTLMVTGVPVLRLSTSTLSRMRLAMCFNVVGSQGESSMTNSSPPQRPGQS